MTGVGTAAGIAALAAPGTAHAAVVADVTVPVDASDSMMAHVSNVRTGEVTLMVSGHEVSVVDQQLAARLAHAFDQAARL